MSNRNPGTRGLSRTDRIRAALSRTLVWLPTSAIAARIGAPAGRITDVLSAMRDAGEIEQRKDPAGSHDVEWRRAVTP